MNQFHSEKARMIIPLFGSTAKSQILAFNQNRTWILRTPEAGGFRASSKTFGKRLCSVHQLGRSAGTGPDSVSVGSPPRAWLYGSLASICSRTPVPGRCRPPREAFGVRRIPPLFFDFCIRRDCRLLGQFRAGRSESGGIRPHSLETDHATVCI